MATKEWYLSKGEKRVGPLSATQIERRAERGKIPRGTLVWREGMDAALPVGEVELGVALAEPPEKKARPKRSSRSGRRRSPELDLEAPAKAKRSKKRSPEVDPEAPAKAKRSKKRAKRVPSSDQEPSAEVDAEGPSRAHSEAHYHGQIELPPISAETSHLTPASIWIKLKKAVVLVFSFVFLTGLLYIPALLFELGWLETTAQVVGGLGILLALGMALTAKVADCPYCEGLLGTSSFDSLTGIDDNEVLECGHCYELLLSHEGEVRALDHEAAAKQKKGLEAPVFEDGHWSNECVACGDDVDHVEEASKTKVELTQLLVGTLSVASASIKDIPYCANHSAEIGITITDDHPRLVFKELGARRRYVHLNRDCKPSKV